MNEQYMADGSFLFEVALYCGGWAKRAFNNGIQFICASRMAQFKAKHWTLTFHDELSKTKKQLHLAYIALS